MNARSKSVLRLVLPWVVSVGLFLSASAAAAKEPSRVRIQADLPTWVSPLALPTASASTSLPGQGAAALGSTGGGTSAQGFLVYDQQARFAKPGPETFLHVAYVVEKPSDVQHGSELSAEYSPDFEELTVHYVRIHREGRVLDALRGAQLREVSPDTNREDFLYDGSRQLRLLLKDVRSLDTIEWAYTIRGQNPALHGRTIAESKLTHEAVVQASQVRWLLPKNGVARFRVHGEQSDPRESTSGEFTEYLWLQNQARAVEPEGNEPSWYIPEPWVELSDFQSWSDVVDWALPLYPEVRTLSPELSALVSRFRSLPSKRDKLLGAVRFVQNELRYLGLEMGLHSLVPHAPRLTLERRFGDCKDKTYLLTTLLNQLEIEAAPALVSSSEGHLLPSRLPSPTDFDHVIAKVTFEGKTLWFDPTDAAERSELEAHQATPYEYALVLAKGVKSLEPMAPQEPRAPLSEIHERYQLAGPEAPVLLTVTTTLSGILADEFRARAERYTQAGLQREFLNFFSKRYGGVEFIEPPTVLDDQASDVIRVLERYRIKELFVDHAVRLGAWSFDEVLESPEVVRRRTPLGLEHPYWGRHRIDIAYQDRPQIVLPNAQYGDGSLRFSVASLDSRANRTMTITYELKSQKDHVSPQEMTEHWLMRRRIDAAHEIELVLRSHHSKEVEPDRNRGRSGVAPWLWASLAGLAIGLAAPWTLRVLRRRSQSRRRAAEIAAAPEA